MQSGHAMQAADQLWFPDGLCQIGRVFFAAALATHQFPPPEPSRPMLPLKAEGKQLLYFRAGAETPKTVPIDRFEDLFEPTPIRAVRETIPLVPAGISAVARRTEASPKRDPNSASSGSPRTVQAQEHLDATSRAACRGCTTRSTSPATTNVAEGGMKKRWLLCAAIAVLLTGCEKARLDDEVDRLCRIDGGIRVYETVKLPKEYFDERGVPVERVIDDRAYYGGGRFVTEAEDRTLIAGNPDLRRIEIRFVRLSDHAVLGRSVSYTRRGGDIPNPFHPSHYSCPSVNVTAGLISKILIKEP